MDVETNTADAAQINRDFYNDFWGMARLQNPALFNTWQACSALCTEAPARLEVAPGLRPRLQLEGTQFVDLSHKAVQKLTDNGANAVVGSITELPFRDQQFDLICALDVVEHVENDQAAFSELNRCLKPGGQLLFSVPLFQDAWTEFDQIVGHVRRYEPSDLLKNLERFGFGLRESAIYGMQPESSRLLDVGMWWMKHYPRRSMFCYNNIFYPLYTRLNKKPLHFHPGLVETEGVDEIILVCQKKAEI